MSEEPHVFVALSEPFADRGIDHRICAVSKGVHQYIIKYPANRELKLLDALICYVKDGSGNLRFQDINGIMEKISNHLRENQDSSLATYF